MRERSLAELLGHPPETKLLIVNADDFGMCWAENAATIEGLARGAYPSSTVMVPCAWFPHAAAYARAHPDASFGVHLTHTSEWESYRWRPVAGRDAVPSLVDAQGYLYPDVRQVYAHATLEDVEREARAQIDAARAAGIDVTHLDSHMGTMQLDVNYHALYIRLAAEYRLPIRMADRGWMLHAGMREVVEEADRRGVLMPDHFHYGGPPAPDQTAAYWTTVLRGLPAGVSELYVHPAHADPELQALGPQWAQRPADHQFFTGPARALLAELGITLMGYRPIRDLQRRLTPC